ncbi:MAG TPA: bifunctional glutamate N-acetyltransferase/amino-acid acetyltransferase ArgJ [Aggregatilineales bacterium]|nr:bifunctional glutamate N-acetyltransferase/amino-acid acetyltransferase ArgJ [Aggregatilineales bacterium]
MPHLERVRQYAKPVKGFRVSGVDAGLRAAFGKPSSPDLALIASDNPCAAAGVFTTNHVKAASVLIDQERIKNMPKGIRGILINTASANACTGEEGLRNARQCAARTSVELQSDVDDVLVMSTGVIGVQLPMTQMAAGIRVAAAALRPDGWADAAKAIMTTDTQPKAANIDFDGITISGIAKGAGMIAPNMATLLCAIATDAVIEPALLQRALEEAVSRSFNCIVVDGDMSTNDSVLTLASGASGIAIAEAQYERFTGCLSAVCISLAQAIVKDAEGASRFITVQVMGAKSPEDARQVGNAIATSPLVKTAFYGGDANWGRIVAAAGRAGVPLEQGKLALWYDDLQLVANGTPLKYDEARANAIAAGPEIHVRLELGLGSAEHTIWTCDLTHDYVDINGHYRT